MNRNRKLSLKNYEKVIQTHMSLDHATQKKTPGRAYDSGYRGKGHKKELSIDQIKAQERKNAAKKRNGGFFARVFGGKK